MPRKAEFTITICIRTSSPRKNLDRVGHRLLGIVMAKLRAINANVQHARYHVRVWEDDA